VLELLLTRPKTVLENKVPEVPLNAAMLLSLGSRLSLQNCMGI
jgi:hypothetical protein